jgi:hypothetical protein
MVMEAAVNEKEVTNPRRRLIVKSRGETREAPTITAKPIIRQFSGLVNRRSPVIFPMVFISAFFVTIVHAQICYAVECSYGYGAFRFCLWWDACSRK